LFNLISLGFDTGFGAIAWKKVSGSLE